jgi:hypothetical protein
MLYKDLNTTSNTILKPAPTAIIANKDGKLIEIVLVIIDIIS